MKRKHIFILLTTLIEISLLVLAIMFLVRENPNKVGGIALIVVVLFILIFIVSNYNKLVHGKNKIKESIALVDIQLKLRFDLIPNLVNVVKGYNKHEKEILAEITKLRKLAVSAKDEKEKIDYANKLVPKLQNLVAVAESYPEVKSSALYKNLMEQLVDIEDRLVAARRIYDSNVSIYNTIIESFPTNFIAYMFGFKREELFKIEAGESINYTIE